MRTLTWIIIIALIILGIYWVVNRSESTQSVTDNTYNSPNNSQSTTTINISPSSTSIPTIATSTSATPKTVTVNYTGSGFSPSSVTIKKGDTVKFVNQNSRGMWVGSAAHPTHEVYDGTNLITHCAAGATTSFDSCKDTPNGSSYSFTFNKVGTWRYHNHSSATHFGAVIVE